jgi:hypothetical protein
MRQLSIGLVYELLGSYPMQPGDPPDADAEYEPEETIETLTRSLTLDKYWAASAVSRAGVRAPAQLVVSPSSDLKTSLISCPSLLFVKRRRKGAAKGIRATSKAAPSMRCSPT